MSEQGFSQRNIGIIVRPFIENGVSADSITDFLQAAAPKGWKVRVEYNYLSWLEIIKFKRPHSARVTVTSPNITSSFNVSTKDVVTQKV